MINTTVGPENRTSRSGCAICTTATRENDYGLMDPGMSRVKSFSPLSINIPFLAAYFSLNHQQNTNKKTNQRQQKANNFAFTFQQPCLAQLASAG